MVCAPIQVALCFSVFSDEPCVLRQKPFLFLRLPLGFSFFWLSITEKWFVSADAVFVVYMGG